MAEAPTLIRWADLRSTPWRNGGGLTREVAASPIGDPAVDFAWRVSIADVDRSGQFSTFEGVDRVITLLEGEAMILDLPGVEQVLVPHEPFAFRGEDPVFCHVQSGSTRDLNLMTRRGVSEGTVQVHRTKERMRLSGGAPLLVLALDSGVEVTGTAEQRWTLARYDVLVTDGPVSVDPGRFAAIRISSPELD